MDVQAGVESFSDFTKKHPDVTIGAVTLLVAVPSAFGE
jgi:hypothetical protein